MYKYTQVDSITPWNNKDLLNPRLHWPGIHGRYCYRVIELKFITFEEKLCTV